MKDDQKAMAKIRKDAEKAKEILTANKDTLLTIESLYHDIDYKVKLTREMFYDLSSALLDRVLTPVKAALEQANLTLVSLTNILIIFIMNSTYYDYAI